MQSWVLHVVGRVVLASNVASDSSAIFRHLFCASPTSSSEQELFDEPDLDDEDMLLGRFCA